MGINQAIFNELLNKGYSVKGKNRIWTLANSKLLYITPELAKGFLNLAKSEVYKKKVYAIEAKLLRDNALKILEPLKGRDFNLIDLGCGDGKKVGEFVRALKNRGSFRYCPVDISSYLINRAISNIKSENFKNVKAYESSVSDFENFDNIIAVLRNDKYQKNMIFLLGNTLANFEINDFLFNLSNGMFERDYLVIGNGIRTGPRLVSLETYKSKAFGDWLYGVMSGLGFKKNEVEYDARFAHSRLECFYKIKVNKKINHLGRRAEFKKGDQVVVAVLYKYYEDELVDFTKRYFSDVQLVKDPDNEHALLICRK